MTKEILKGWRKQAKLRRHLRYPRVEIGISPGYGSYKTKMRMSTFVEKDGRLMLVSDGFELDVLVDVWEGLEAFKKHFYTICALTIEKGIFNTKTSIKEPK